MELELISHALCPYVQRAVIMLREKGIDYERTDIDLSNKPDWFTAISPLGKTPVLRVDGKHIIFESAVICEYLDETQGETKLHPSNPLERASHRSWIEFASAGLSDIAGLYTAPDASVFDQKRESLRQKLGQVENKLGSGPFFSGTDFSLVDAAFAPFFRYFDTLEEYSELVIFAGHPRTSAWRKTLAARPSVIGAVSEDYPERLTQFLVGRESHLSALILSATDTI